MKTASFVFVVLVSGFLSETAFAKNCLERHGALDIGSGSTKAFAAVVDVCEKKIVTVLFEGSRPISFNDALEKSDSGEIPLGLIDEAGKKISLLIASMKEKDVESFTAIATSAFRVAKNGPNAADILSGKISIPIKIVSQDEEAEIGYISALAQSQVPPKDRESVIVWDIGGGSMQMRAKTKQGDQLFKGDLASVTFKNRVIQEIQSKDPKSVSSPNPLGRDFMKATKLAQEHAKSNVPIYFKQKATKARWIGIGGVLAISTQTQVDPKKKTFSKDELERALAKRSRLKDEEIQSDYRYTDITNLALVLGYMKALGIDKVETAESSLLRGWLLYRLPDVSNAQDKVAFAR